MSNRPFGAFVIIPMPYAEHADLLLYLLKRLFMIVTHPQILFNGIVLFCWYVYRMIPAVRKALCDQMCITAVCFNALPLFRKHCCRCKDHTLYSCGCELVVERISQAARLITAFDIVGIIHTEFLFQIFNEHDNVLVIRCYLDICKDTILRSDYWLHCT